MDLSSSIMDAFLFEADLNSWLNRPFYPMWIYFKMGIKSASDNLNISVNSGAIFISNLLLLTNISSLETGLYLPGKPLTVLSPQVSGSSPSIYSGAKVKEESYWCESPLYILPSYFGVGKSPEGYPQFPKPSKPHPHDPIIGFNT